MGQLVVGMPRYFLHVHNGGRVFPDPDGMDHADLGSARTYALQVIDEFVAEGLLDGPISGHFLELCDADDTTLEVIAFASSFR
eukprot:gene55319-73885_t